MRKSEYLDVMARFRNSQNVVHCALILCGVMGFTRDPLGLNG